MQLTDQQHDALIELINIAFSRAAAALSELTGQRVIVEVPRVAVHPIDRLATALSEFVHGEIATVHQIFTGQVAGDALLLLGYESAMLLTDLLTEGRRQGGRLDSSDREVLTEVGNIVLNACLGSFGNIVNVHISFSVPRMHIEALGDLLDSLVIGQEELRYALVVRADFRLRDSAVGGYLVIVLGVASLDRLVHAVESLG